MMTPKESQQPKETEHDNARSSKTSERGSAGIKKGCDRQSKDGSERAGCENTKDKEKKRETNTMDKYINTKERSQSRKRQQSPTPTKGTQAAQRPRKNSGKKK